MSSEAFFVMTLGERPSMSLVDAVSLQEHLSREGLAAAIHYAGGQCFQDWLVDARGKSVGVRLTVIDEVDGFESLVPVRAYIERHVPGLVSFWFGLSTSTRRCRPRRTSTA